MQQNRDADQEYVLRLVRLQRARWKRLLGVQAPYRWNLNRLKPGFCLEIGCGIGRNLQHLGGRAVGIDLNIFAVAHARSSGFRAYTPDEFDLSEFNVPQTFDSLLLSHVAEHMTSSELILLLQRHAPLVKDLGRLILICPQERGYASDESHVEFMDFAKLRLAAQLSGFTHEDEYSFPFPRAMGKLFVYNEFVSIHRKEKR